MAAKKKSDRVVMTPELFEKIKTLAAFGLTDEQIAVVVAMTESTLKRKALLQLKEGRLMANVKVIESAYKQAVSGKCPAMTMFWLKCRLGWREVPRDDATDAAKVDQIKEAVKDIASALMRDCQPAPKVEP